MERILSEEIEGLLQNIPEIKGSWYMEKNQQQVIKEKNDKN